MFQFVETKDKSILIFDDLEVLLPHDMSITSMVQCRLSAFFFDTIRNFQLNRKNCVIIGIVNQTQLSSLTLNPMICCLDVLQKIVVIPKLDKKRRLAILHHVLHSILDSTHLERLADETASYSAADLNAFCSFCLQNPHIELIMEHLNQQRASITRQFNSVKPLPGGFSSLVGMEKIKQEVVDNILSPLLNWDYYALYNLQPPSGCLFYGPSGCGKTAVIQAIAYELRNRVEVIEVTCTDLLSKVGLHIRAHL